MASSHFTTEQLTERFEFSAKFRNIVFGLIGVGLVLIFIGSFIAKSNDSHGSDDHSEHAVVEQTDYIHSVADTQHGDDHAEDDHGDDQHSDDAHAGEDHGASAHGDGAHHADAGHHGDDHGGHGHHEPTWITRILSAFLVNNLYFITIAMGALFFIAIHKVGNGGWQTAIHRVPEAMTMWIPFAAVGFIVLLLFANQIFEWLLVEPGADALIDTKRAYLNLPFFAVRTVLFFAIWGVAAYVLRNLSIKEDIKGGLGNFHKSVTVSAVFIILFAISYSLFAIDWIKSLEPHWFSTIFGVYVFAGSFLSAMATMSLILHFLKSQGYMKYVNGSHFHDVNKFAFGFTVFWAYIWVAQLLLIWYSNIPEEGIYYVKRYRVEDHAYLGYAPIFYINLIINFVIPFLALMTRDAKRFPKTFVPICIIILIGHWIDLFLMVMPGAMLDKGTIGIVEIGFFLTYLGAFLFVVLQSLTKANLVPLKHPYLEESLHHTTGPV